MSTTSTSSLSFSSKLAHPPCHLCPPLRLHPPYQVMDCCCCMPRLLLRRGPQTLLLSNVLPLQALYTHVVAVSLNENGEAEALSKVDDRKISELKHEWWIVWIWVWSVG